MFLIILYLLGVILSLLVINIYLSIHSSCSKVFYLKALLGFSFLSIILLLIDNYKVTHIPKSLYIYLMISWALFTYSSGELIKTYDIFSSPAIGTVISKNPQIVEYKDCKFKVTDSWHLLNSNYTLKFQKSTPLNYNATLLYLNIPFFILSIFCSFTGAFLLIKFNLQ